MGDAEQGGGDKCRLQLRQLRMGARDPFHLRHEAVGIGCLFAHAAAAIVRGLKETMIDFEVGVWLSTPALPSGTSTLSSG